MANLSQRDKEVLYGSNWRAIDAQIAVESAQRRDRLKRFMPAIVAMIAAGVLLAVAVEVFF
jgi:hypothetical protein